MLNAGRKIEKGRFTRLPSELKDPVTDHQQLSSAICAVAISPTHANQIVR
jgi:hypothetical protein